MLVAVGGAASAGGDEFPVTGIEDLLLAALEPGLWRHVADRAVQAHGIVVRDVARRYAKPILEGQRPGGQPNSPTGGHPKFGCSHVRAHRLAPARR